MLGPLSQTLAGKSFAEMQDLDDPTAGLPAQSPRALWKHDSKPPSLQGKVEYNWKGLCGTNF